MSPPTRRTLLLAGALLGPALLLPGPARAAREPRLELVLDTAELSVGQSVTAQLRVIDGVLRSVPELPVGDGLQARFTGQGTQHVMVNFESTRITSFSYTLTAVAPGSWEVGPVSVTLGKEALTVPARTVQVRPRDAAEAKVQDVVATLSDTEPFLGEVVVYRFRHQHAERLVDLDWTPPSFDGLVSEKVAEPSQREYTVREEGAAMGVEEITVPLVASAVGDRVIPPAVVTARFPTRDRSTRRSPFMSAVETRTLASEPIALRIRPLPEAGRPPDFSGLVGRFTLQATARREGGGSLRPDEVVELALGDSLTIEVTLAGDGTLAGVTLPPAPADAGYRAYDDSPEIQARLDDGRLASVATFRRAVVPEAEGELTVAPIALAVFDPEQEAYVTLRTEPITLRVLPGEEGRAEVRSFGEDEGEAVDTRTEVEALGEDILPVPGSARVRDRSLQAALPLALGLPALPALGLLGLGLHGLAARRRPDPRQALRRQLRELPAEPAPRTAALVALFREAAGLRLRLPAAGLTWQAVAELGPEAAQLYDDLERARYGGGAEALPALEARVRAFVEAT